MISLLRWSLTAAALIAAGTSGMAQPAAPAGEAVPVDFFVTGPDGPVFDLRADEVSLEVDGKPRRIRWLRYIPLHHGERAPVAAPADDIDPPFGTNVPGADGRWVTIVLDHESIRRGSERNAVNAVVGYIETLGPRDRVSYVTAPNGALEIDFTTSHHRVTDALKKFIGSGLRAPLEQERSCRSRLLLNAMRDLLEGMTALNGPKVVVLVSSGMLNPRRDAPMLGPPGPCEIVTADFQDVASAASGARAHLFVLRPDDLRMDRTAQDAGGQTAGLFAGSDADRAGLESLAGVSGGEFIQVVGPDDTTLVNRAGGLSGYYVATFDPAPGDRNDAMHRVAVTVARANTRVRTNPDVYIPRIDGKTVSVTPAAMIRNAIVYRELPLRISAFASSGQPGTVNIHAVLEPAEPGVAIAQAVFGLVDQRNRLVVQWTADRSALAGVPIVTVGAAAPGPYSLRVAAIDSAGRRGKAEYAFLAQLTEAAPLKLSALAVGTSANGAFQPKLVFGADPAAEAYFEIYGKAASVIVRLDIGHEADSRAIVTGQARVTSQGPDRRVAAGALPISGLQPGDYVLRAVVSVDGRPVGRITRTIRKRPGG
jgi:VWFA-related protein